MVLDYLRIVRKTYEDMVPKIVFALLINRAKAEIGPTLVDALHTSIHNPESLLKGEWLAGFFEWPGC